MKEELIEVGLNENEAEVYLYLLKSEKPTATRIAKETKINRTVVYVILEKLIEKGLVNFILIDGKRHFSATNPKALQDFLADKQRALSKILPSLENIRKKEKEDFSCEVYEGVKGGVAVLKDIIRDGKDYVSFGDEGQFESISDTLVEQYLRQLDEKGIRERILTKEGTKFKFNRKKTEIRYLSKEFSFPTLTTIYGDKVAIAVFEEPYHVILIKSGSLAKTYKDLFEGLWKISKN